MLKKVTFFLFLVCFSTNLFPQIDYPTIWDWQNPFPSGDDFTTSINVPDGVVFGGSGGSLIYANKKGKKELEKYLHEEVTDAALDTANDVIFVLTHDKYTDKSHIFGLSPSSGGFKQIKSLEELATFDKPISSVATDGKSVVLVSIGNIYSSIDGGKDFTTVPISEDELLNDAIFTATGRGIAIGENDGNDSNRTNIYLKDPVTDPNDPESSDQWHPLSKNHSTNNARRVALYSRKWKSGASVDKNISPPLHKTLQNDPIFILGYEPATNSDIVARSTDNGSSWDSVFAVQTAYMKALSVGSDANAIIGGYDGTIYYTRDGGDTWEKGNNEDHEYIHSITHVSADSAYAFGNNGIILLTIDGGENWTQISGDISTSFYGVYFLSPSVGYTAGVSGPDFSMLKVYKTIDAGDNWNVVYVDTSFSPSFAFVNSIFFVDEMTGFIAGSKLIKTTDGGNIWNELNTGASPTSIFQDVYFVNNNRGFVVYRDPLTGDGAIKTTDGGTMWTPLNINNDRYDKQYVYFADENLGFISGSSTLYRTTDGGDNWDTLAVGTNKEDLNSKVAFVNSTTGFFGKKGMVFKTTDKGETWTDATIDNHSVPKLLQFVSDSIGYLISVSDTFGIPVHVLFKTTDSGNSWSDLTDGLPGSTSFGAMYFTDENTGYLVGPHGKIVKTTSGGEVVTSVREIDNASVPSGYELYQNYPNPFNPSTIIRWHTSITGRQTLKIFDILGREVATLIDEYKPAGTYEIEFNASGLASGVYFYRLQGGDYTATKKLLLLK